LYRAEKLCKKERRPFCKKTELAAEMIAVAAAALPAREIRVVGDNAYANHSIVRGLPGNVNYTLVVAWYLTAGHRSRAARLLQLPWYTKTVPAFSDMLATLRRESWSQRLSPSYASTRARQKSLAPLLQAVGYAAKVLKSRLASARTLPREQGHQRPARLVAGRQVCQPACELADPVARIFACARGLAAEVGATPEGPRLIGAAPSGDSIEGGAVANARALAWGIRPQRCVKRAPLDGPQERLPSGH
jgi:hypothetical protein